MTEAEKTLASVGAVAWATPQAGQAPEPDRNDPVQEALAWYAEQVAGCRKLGHIGDPHRHLLDADGGARARAALAYTHQPVQATAQEPACPDILFDGNAVLAALAAKAQSRTSAENVSDVLDAVVRLLRVSPINRNTEGATDA